MTTVKVRRKNQIAVPAAVRRRLGIRPGDLLDVNVEDSCVVLRARRRTALADLLAIAPDVWRGADAERYVPRTCRAIFSLAPRSIERSTPR